jgi:hypothetical protein
MFARSAFPEMHGEGKCDTEAMRAQNVQTLPPKRKSGKILQRVFIIIF